MAEQSDIDARNSAFWDELCGSALARSAGITGDDPNALERYDATYFAFYPYLRSYVDRFEIATRRVLEIGLGYGTLGSYLISRGADYYGLDIAEGPVAMMRHRLDIAGIGPPDRVEIGTALRIPHEEGSFDFVYSIGCLHHTGDIRGSVREIRRVLRPGGHAVVMLYNRRSLRQLLAVDLPRLRARIHRSPGPSADRIRQRYDSNSAGEAAPHTDYVSRRDVKRLFGEFQRVQIDTHNFDDLYRGGKLVVPRQRVLATSVERVLGLDLYVVAQA